jgi:hypothetical protein
VIGGVAARPPAVEPAQVGPTPAQAEDEGARSLRGRVPVAWLVLAVLALATPLVVALVVQHEPRWYPTGDSAQIELRVRDVFSAHPPQLGLGGRIGGPGEAQGSHPGPLAFYLMAPLHRLLGDTAWALQVATAFVHVAALATALWLVRRRGGALLFLGATAALGLVVAACTAELLTVPWNPYLPLLWLPAFVLAVWSVTDDDLVALPVAAFAGSVCVQTHVPYTGVVGVGALVVLGWAAFRWWRPGPAGLRRARVATAVAVSAGVALVVWLPPLFQQLTAESGNLARVVDYFLHPPGDTLGAGDGLRLLLIRLDPWRLLTDRNPDTPFAAGSSTVPATVLLAVWAASVVAAWRLRAPALLRLHGVVAAAVLAALLAFSRIYGAPFAYLSLWTLCLLGLVFLAVGWTVGLVVGRLLPAGTAERLRPVATVALAVAVLAVVASATVEASSAEPTEPATGRVVAGVAGETIAALRAGDLPGTGEGGTYLVTTTDPSYLTSPMHGLVDELERAGLDVGSEEPMRVALTPHRILGRDDATAEVHLAIGPTAAEVPPGAAEVARFDPADGPDPARFAEARAEAVERLRAVGAPDLADRVEEVAAISGDPRVDPTIRSLLDELRELGVPAAVFVTPLG